MCDNLNLEDVRAIHFTRTEYNIWKGFRSILFVFLTVGKTNIKKLILVTFLAIIIKAFSKNNDY